MLSSNTVQLKLVEPPVPAPVSYSPIVLRGPDDEPDPDPSAATVVVAKLGQDPASRSRAKMRRRALCVGLAALGLLALVAAGVRRGLWSRPPGVPPAGSGSEAAVPAVTDRPSPAPHQPESVEINIAYGTESQFSDC